MQLYLIISLLCLIVIESITICKNDSLTCYAGSRTEWQHKLCIGDIFRLERCYYIDDTMAYFLTSSFPEGTIVTSRLKLDQYNSNCAVGNPSMILLFPNAEIRQDGPSSGKYCIFPFSVNYIQFLLDNPKYSLVKCVNAKCSAYKPTYSSCEEVNPEKLFKSYSGSYTCYTLLLCTVSNPAKCIVPYLSRISGGDELMYVNPDDTIFQKSELEVYEDWSSGSGLFRSFYKGLTSSIYDGVGINSMISMIFICGIFFLLCFACGSRCCAA